MSSWNYLGQLRRIMQLLLRLLLLLIMEVISYSSTDTWYLKYSTHRSCSKFILKAVLWERGYSNSFIYLIKDYGIISFLKSISASQKVMLVCTEMAIFALQRTSGNIVKLSVTEFIDYYFVWEINININGNSNIWTQPSKQSD